MSFSASKQVQAVGVKAAGDGAPSTDQMKVINTFTLKELAAADVYVRSVYLAHNGIDRDAECFDDALLEDFARTLPGKGFFVKHPMSFDGSSGPGEGNWFEAQILTMTLDEARALLKQPDLQFAPDTTEAKILEASYYMLRLDYDPETRKLIDKTDAGIAGRFSIGFSAKGRVDVLDANNNVIAQRIFGPGEAREGSVVWLESQYGAHAFKNAQQTQDEPNEEEPPMAMSTEEKAAYDEAKNSAKAANDKVIVLEPKATAHDEIMNAAGEGATVESIKALMEAGKAFRKSLEDDLLRLERLQGVVGDDDAAEKEARATYSGMSNEAIKSRVDALAKKYPGTGEIDGGDPNAGGAGQDGGAKGLRDESVTQKAMEQAQGKAA